MMWKAKHRPKLGDTRVGHKFAWLPFEFCICCDFYYVWVENYQVDQEYTTFTKNCGEGTYRSSLQWEIIKQEPIF
jgi:hypothetical protein